mgnify:CR=1 FL=1
MRKTTQEKRKKFVKTTEELFYKRGYKDTSIKDICEALETTTGSFYFMFDSKEGILEEIVKEINNGKKIMNSQRKCDITRYTNDGRIIFKGWYAKIVEGYE